jgi:hypothetical protein
VRATSGLRAEYPESWHALSYGENNNSLEVTSFPLLDRLTISGVAPALPRA